MSVSANQQKKKWLGRATIAFMITVPLICGYVTWSQFEIVATRFRWGRVDLLGSLRVLLSVAMTLCSAWAFWGSLILVKRKRWKKSQSEKKKADPVGTDTSALRAAVSDLNRSPERI